MRRAAAICAALIAAGLLASAAWAYFTATKTSPQPISVAPITPPAANIKYESSSSAAVDASQITVPKPAGVQPGWVLVATLGTLKVHAPEQSGWTGFGGTINSPSLLLQRSFYRVAGPSEPANYTFTLSGVGKAVAGIAAYSGVRAANPIEGSAGASGKSATATAPVVNASYDTRRIVPVTSAKTDPVTFTGATKVWDRASGATRSAAGDAAQPKGPSGATTVRVGDDEWAIQTIVLNGTP